MFLKCQEFVQMSTMRGLRIKLCHLARARYDCPMNEFAIGRATWKKTENIWHSLDAKTIRPIHEHRSAAGLFLDTFPLKCFAG